MGETPTFSCTGLSGYTTIWIKSQEESLILRYCQSILKIAKYKSLKYELKIKPTQVVLQ